MYYHSYIVGMYLLNNKPNKPYNTKIITIDKLSEENILNLNKNIN